MSASSEKFMHSLPLMSSGDHPRPNRSSIHDHSPSHDSLRRSALHCAEPAM